MTSLHNQRASWRSSVGASSLASDKSYAPQENGEWKESDRNLGEEAEEGIEEAFEPPHDEEAARDAHRRAQDEKVKQEEEKKDLVEWDGPNDPENPQNMSRSRKWLITVATGLMTFVVSFGSSVFSTVTEVTAEEFGVSNEVMILGVTLYVLGFACGPLVWGPMSEAYGKSLSAVLRSTVLSLKLLTAICPARQEGALHGWVSGLHHLQYPGSSRPKRPHHPRRALLCRLLWQLHARHHRRYVH